MSQVSALEFAKPSGNKNITLEPRRGAKFLFTKASIDSERQEQVTKGVQELNSPTSFKAIIRIILESLFRKVNHRYYRLDEYIFKDNSQSWNSSSFLTLKKASLELSAEIKFFPVLLFQYFVLNILLSPLEYDPILGSLRYSIYMSFDDVAGDYSQSIFTHGSTTQEACHCDLPLKRKSYTYHSPEEFSMVPESSKALAFRATLEFLNRQKALFDILSHKIAI
ncbi:uncharacterized protein EAF01_005213 [Botrytis porri]|nr:uncharacterized protein EAF01_005213 [Botrytis porri]KAF7907627.1 hypothetical protein EAF01_005213 [Botrytis porri]